MRVSSESRWGTYPEEVCLDPHCHGKHTIPRLSVKLPQLLAVFKTRCDGPPHATHVHQFFQRRVHRSMAQVALQLLRLDVPTQHQPDLRTGQPVPHSHHPYGSKRRDHWSLAAFFAGVARPRRSGPRPCHFQHRPRLWSARHPTLLLRATAAPTPRREVGGRALLPDSRSVGHFGTIPQAQPRDAIQKAWAAPKRLVRDDPTTPQRLALDHRRAHLLGQRGLGLAGEIWRQTTRPAPYRLRVIGAPFYGHIPPPLPPGVALETPLAHTHAGLAVRPLTQFPAVLTFHTNSMIALLRDITPINHQHPIVGTQVRFHCFPVLRQQPLIVPLPFADQGLHGPYRLGSNPVHRQHHRLERLAWQRRQQPLERGRRRFPLFSPLQQGTVDGMIGTQLLHPVFNILDRQVHLWRRLDQCGHAALLPLMAQRQYYTTFRILVVVLGAQSLPRSPLQGSAPWARGSCGHASAARRWQR